MPKLLPITEDDGQVKGYLFECPGCQIGHYVTIEPYRASNGASWRFNGDLEKPTFQPSVLSRWDFDPVTQKESKVCHLFVREGKIHYLSDCTHSLASQVIDLPEFSD